MDKLLIIANDGEDSQAMRKYLEQVGYEVVLVVDMRNLESNVPEADLVIVNTDFSPIDGIGVTQFIKEKYPKVVVLFVSNFTDQEQIEKVVLAGADDFIVGTVSAELLEIKARLVLEARMFHEIKTNIEQKMKIKLADNKEVIQQLIQENAILSEESLNLLARIGEMKDYETHEHTRRVALVSRKIAENLGLDSGAVKRLELAAPLHDLGKLFISADILWKPAKLSSEEWAIMKTHTTRGWRLLKNAKSSVLKLAATIALTHHERWDGSGYPRRLKAKNIPVEGRIVAVADSLDAMVSKRPYKKQSKSLAEAFNEIKELSEKWYDPEIVDALMNAKGEICNIYRATSTQTILPAEPQVSEPQKTAETCSNCDGDHPKEVLG